MPKLGNNTRKLKSEHIRYLTKLLNDESYLKERPADAETIKEIVDSGYYNTSEAKVFNEIIVPQYEQYKRLHKLFNDDLPFLINNPW